MGGALCLILVVLAYFQLQSVDGAESISGLGVNWGSLAYHPMNPQIVATMLKDNGIKKVKLFDANSWTVTAFSGTDIEVMLGISNDQLSKFATSTADAEDWVKQNITKHLHNNGGVNIRYVAVGNEPFLKGYNGSYVNSTLPAMQNIQKAIANGGYGDKIKVTTALNADVFESSSNKPSDGDFRSDILDVMKQILQFLHEKDSPFLVNIYPFFNVYQDVGFPHDFAFFDSQSSTIDDGNATYTNVFDANIDTLLWTLKKNGYPGIKIVVGEIGWPTDGDKNANINNAKRFYQGFLKKMATKKGTPIRPEPMEVYLFSLFDENLKGIEPGNFERHWGIFHYDGKPKFPIDLSGQGQEDKWPEAAKGVRYQDRKWCVLNEDVNNLTLVQDELTYACAGADCTSIGNDCSCGNLTLSGNASFAFNQYFQTRNQSVEACGFNGLGSIVTKDPSKGSCLFPIQLIESLPPKKQELDQSISRKESKELESSAEMLIAMRSVRSLLIGLTLLLLLLLYNM